jgi:hypothetical protein
VLEVDSPEVGEAAAAESGEDASPQRCLVAADHGRLVGVTAPVLVDVGLGRTVAFLSLHHTLTRADPALDEVEQIAGAWAPHADVVLMLKKLDGNRARLSYPKPPRYARAAIPAAILAFDPDTETYTVMATDDDQTEKVGPDTYDQRVLDFVSANPWATTDQVDNEKRARDDGLPTATGRTTELHAAANASRRRDTSQAPRPKKSDTPGR